MDTETDPGECGTVYNRELKEYESKILGAEEKILELETSCQ